MEGLKGIFQCSLHNMSYDNLDEFYAHESTVEHHRLCKVICPKCGSNGIHTEFEETDTIIALSNHSNLIHFESQHLCSTCEIKQKQLLDERIAKRQALEEK